MRTTHARIFAATTLMTLLTASAVSAQAVLVEDRAPTLTATGRGEVQSAPDRAVVSFGAIAESPEAAAAQHRVNEIMEAAIDAVKDQDIKDNRLSTSNLTLQPIYEQRKRDEGVYEPRIRAYQASYTLTVVVDDIAKVGDVIDAALKSGINQFHGVQFTLKDDTSARIRALALAAKDAAAKAEAIAKALNVRLVRVKRVTESGDAYPPPQPLYMARRAMAMEADVSTPVQAGELSLTTSVTVEYEIAPTE